MLTDSLHMAEEEDFAGLQSQPIPGGEPRNSQFTGTKALMLAVLEDGIRSYLGRSRVLVSEAECWIFSHSRRSPFTFVVLCETLGLQPDAVRATLKRLKSTNVPARKALPRARNNVRVPGRVNAQAN